MQTISDRIKLIRLTTDGKKLTQEEFGKRLGLSRGVVTNLEDSENRLPNGISESTLRLICATFNVNYPWLTTGEGEMYRSLQPEERFNAFVEKHTPDESPFFKSLAVMAAKRWTDAQWEMFRDFVERLKANPEGEPEDGEQYDS